MDERKRDSIIAYLRSRMAEFGITEGALAESLADAPVVKPPPSFTRTNGAHGAKAARPMPQLPSMPHSGGNAVPIFRNASGDTWDGLGDMPEWLKRAVHAGQDIEFYRV
ncbi:H-NS family nucleoid-associated regulatory protein [Caballeronia insecticola]|nr:H-NS family nucleoid-associated regulatory protein [Caballeronia insecticola]